MVQLGAFVDDQMLARLRAMTIPPVPVTPQTLHRTGTIVLCK